MREITDASTLGRLVREVRRAQGLTQSELAGVSGLGTRFVHDLESGKQTCELGKALHIVGMLGIRLDAVPPRRS